MGIHLMKIAVTLTLIGFAGFFFCSVVRCTPDTNVTNVLCNGGLYTAGDPFAVSLAYVLQELETAAPAHKNYDSYNISPYPNAFAYGHASCNKNITAPDCTTCLGAAKTDMSVTCQNAIGGRAVLVDCAVRYEQYPFTD
ncbi:antifungal protein ginkbilobin-like protein [Pyrus x bretschneideri]|uniref:antifungal protein ginkbilobin-like protein n=1 Tax=Pyrus x bretschneideri TaxID=225117 RepID=UPI00202E78DF|nr:antifungal protein ginkbilobin-like protein [Pyrus x bretschneideri]